MTTPELDEVVLPPLPEWMLDDGITTLADCDLRKELQAYAAAAVLAERERCAKLCEGAREATYHSSDGLKRVGAMNMASSCAMLIRGADRTQGDKS